MNGNVQTSGPRGLDRVLFRVWKSGPFKGDVTAILPDVPANPGRMMMYEHVGQHGEGDYGHVLCLTRRARPDEYAELKQELETRGYHLRVMKRYQRRHRGRRWGGGRP